MIIVVRRLAALALLGVVVAVLYMAVVAPLVAVWTGAGDKVRVAQAQLARYAAIAATAAPLEQALAERRDDGDQGAAAFEGASETLVVAQVQDHVRAAVDQGGGQLTSVRVLPSGEDGPFRRVGLRVQIEATLPSLQRTLYALESGHPVLVLDHLSLRALPRPGRANEADPVLAVQVEVQGFARIVKP